MPSTHRVVDPAPPPWGGPSYDDSAGVPDEVRLALTPETVDDLILSIQGPSLMLPEAEEPSVEPLPMPVAAPSKRAVSPASSFDATAVVSLILLVATAVFAATALALAGLLSILVLT